MYWLFCPTYQAKTQMNGQPVPNDLSYPLTSKLSDAVRYAIHHYVKGTQGSLPARISAFINDLGGVTYL